MNGKTGLNLSKDERRSEIAISQVAKAKKEDF